MPLRAWAWPLPLATVVVWALLLSVVLAPAVASLAGCGLIEAGAQHCVIGGCDMGGVVVRMFVLGSLMLLKAPFMIATAVGLVSIGPRPLWRRLTNRSDERRR